MTTAAETNDPIGRIARRVGYTSELAFSRAFSRHYGQPPGRYRRDAAPAPR
jgi:AraC-like DNA-binding protein